MSSLGRHGGGGFRHGGGFRRGGGGGYFAPPSYGYPVYYDEPNYVPVFIVDDDDDTVVLAKKQAAAKKEAAKSKAAASGLGILAPRARQLHRTRMSGLGAMVYGGSTYDAAVAEAQTFLNTLLASRGYGMIGVDGKLGKATCGAVAWLMQGGANDYDKDVYFDLNTAPKSVFDAWNVCASSAQTPPSPVTSAAKTSSYNVAVTQNATAPLDTAAVMDAQNALNVALKAAGMCAIGVDGKAGGETCGAQTWLIANAGGDGLTQTQRDAISRKCSTSSKTTPGACPIAPPPPPGPAPAPIVVPPVPTKPKISTASMVMGVGIVAAIAAVGYTYFKHKSGG